ncbi:PhzF family phenazine biosynthesis protein [Massilia arenosa]|uniref:PhzF family phenazine biosynthesis protein n=1 Tax=Zemynaea arenosa TaxID=2561931 RepID=A0A4Y9SBE4_9BURK|nr:PhzF family phenazine biosynthesis protein [Massilia arenosa]TFW16934.1 PhzF family phenazine biosynthesis protein [Massilia arenosa]
MDILELKCFGLGPGQGNSALVVTGDSSSVDERLRFAREQAKPACVFIDRGDDGVPVLDFYYPHKRSPLCGHATLAAAYHLVAAGAGPVEVRTAMQGQRICLVREGDIVYLELHRQEAPAADIGTDALRALLRAPELVPVTAPVVASVGSPKLLVQVHDVAELRALAPDLAAIDAWSRALGVNGIYAWCLRGEAQDAGGGTDPHATEAQHAGVDDPQHTGVGDLQRAHTGEARPAGGMPLTVEGRNFNHLDAALEDSATGVGAGALTVLLGRALRLHQGAVVGNPCLVHTQIDGPTIRVGGLVTTLS